MFQDCVCIIELRKSKYKKTQDGNLEWGKEMRGEGKMLKCLKVRKKWGTDWIFW